MNYAGKTKIVQISFHNATPINKLCHAKRETRTECTTSQFGHEPFIEKKKKKNCNDTLPFHMYVAFISNFAFVLPLKPPRCTVACQNNKLFKKCYKHYMHLYTNMRICRHVHMVGYSRKGNMKCRFPAKFE
ncbi:hypothetical protein POVWA2_032330 [Plasmodium ovale wallikeri]|uniref:Uncharacterized protein n=1 Tax=Plasmodium ovale wallikeri TaxID=864142 RepID=A0A1A8YY26_PLAOA|nr:hypothetical protein POVWA1_032700 [Plasmodium ovale wallikeri]SBT36888.1 hypothetical protein POVWA2_032330 [Plasmodium ovale wallikeri]